MKIVMIGAGNTATVLAKLMVKRGHEILQVISRKREHAQLLAAAVQAQSGELSDTISPDGDLYVIALSDGAIKAVGNIKGLKDKTICHTAGSVSMDVLNNVSGTFGVLYPLQSLSKFNDTIPEIPFLVDGNNEHSKNFLLDFARSLSKDVSIADDAERLKYHISAVFVHNFANHIFALAENYCKTENIEFSKLIPLLKELIHKVEKFGAMKSQTGPAIRNDSVTIEKHLAILSSHPQMKSMYQLISQSIVDAGSFND